MASSLPAPMHDAHGPQSRSSAQYDARSGLQSAAALGERGGEFLTFSCDGVACAAPLATIREALMSTPALASLPDSPAWFLGVFQWRSEILGVADMRLLLLGHVIVGEGAPAHERYLALTGYERALLVGTGAQSLALLVESIGDILALRPHEVLLDLVEHPAFGAIAPRYRVGLLAPDGYTTRFAVVALDTLLADMLNALTNLEVAANA